jgi:outer membrane protein OmpA-like peptidoglycan-associated protein
MTIPELPPVPRHDPADLKFQPKSQSLILDPMNTRKTLLLGLFALTALSTSRPLAAQEPKPLDASALKVLETKPVVFRTRGKQPTEKSREYRTSNDATAGSGTAKGRGVRITTYENDTVEERPLVEIPLLFEVNSDHLKGSQSEANLRLLAEKLKSLAADGIQVSIEGHASAEGAVERNLELSKQRAEAIHFRLRELGVNPALLQPAKGYGSVYAEHSASAPEAHRELDRRVLVVRER